MLTLVFDIKRHGALRRPADLREAPRLAFSEAASAGDWTLFDTKDRAHIIDGPWRMTANNAQLLLASVLAGAGMTYGPTFVFGEHLRRDDSWIIWLMRLATIRPGISRQRLEKRQLLKPRALALQLKPYAALVTARTRAAAATTATTG